jgi:hypothetical protein
MKSLFRIALVTCALMSFFAESSARADGCYICGSGSQPQCKRLLSLLWLGYVWRAQPVRKAGLQSVRHGFLSDGSQLQGLHGSRRGLDKDGGDRASMYDTERLAAAPWRSSRHGLAEQRIRSRSRRRFDLAGRTGCPSASAALH